MYSFLDVKVSFIWRRITVNHCTPFTLFIVLAVGEVGDASVAVKYHQYTAISVEILRMSSRDLLFLYLGVSNI